MFEAKLKDSNTFKKLIDSIRELVTEVNFDTNPNGMSCQAMDSSHVALVTLSLWSDGFEYYRSDKPLTLGVQITNLSKIIKCGGGDDSITLKAENDPSSLNILFENKSTFFT